MNSRQCNWQSGEIQDLLSRRATDEPRGRGAGARAGPRLGVEQMVDEELQVKQRERGYSEGQAIGALVHNLLLGGECLSDLEVLRGDPGTQELLAQEAILAPRTAGEFLHKFDIGDIHDLQRVNLRLQQRVRPHQTSPTCTIDLDSSIYEQASTHKQGSDKAYNGEIGYHPLLAFWAEEGELLFSHLRRGSAHTCRNVLLVSTGNLQAGTRPGGVRAPGGQRLL